MDGTAILPYVSKFRNYTQHGIYLVVPSNRIGNQELGVVVPLPGLFVAVNVAVWAPVVAQVLIRIAAVPAATP